jgi:uncharacterized membrane-anchored protein
MTRRTWLFVAAVALQLIVLLSVPAPKVWTRYRGTSALLAIEPADPFDPMRGWYLTLRYEAGRPGAYEGAERPPNDRTIWAVVEPDEDGVARPVRLSLERPRDLSGSELLLRGWVRKGRIDYGVETFFVPEKRREEIEQDLRDHIAEARAEVRIGADGQVALIGLQVADRRY